MYKTKTTMAIMVIATVIGSSLAYAQQPAKLASVSTVKKTIGFRLANWETAHFHDASAADKTETALKKIGCETQRQAHDGHIDLRYRCVGWKQLTVETDEHLVQWHQWLGDRGMQTLVVDPPASMNMVTVRYQMSKQGHLHIHDADEAVHTQQALEMIGCIVSKSEHNGHIDLTFNCPEWKTIGFPVCAIAHEWEAWLKLQGFRTEHKH